MLAVRTVPAEPRVMMPVRQRGFVSAGREGSDAERRPNGTCRIARISQRAANLRIWMGSMSITDVCRGGGPAHWPVGRDIPQAGHSDAGGRAAKSGL
jgi:hypothetical protein